MSLIIRCCTRLLPYSQRSNRAAPRAFASSSDLPPTSSGKETARESQQKESGEETIVPKNPQDVGDELEEEEMVEMWNMDAVAGPEWNGPRGYEPTRHGDWSHKGRVSDF